MKLINEKRKRGQYKNVFFLISINFYKCLRFRRRVWNMKYSNSVLRLGEAVHTTIFDFIYTLLNLNVLTRLTKTSTTSSNKIISASVAPNFLQRIGQRPHTTFDSRPKQLHIILETNLWWPRTSCEIIEDNWKKWKGSVAGFLLKCSWSLNRKEIEAKKYWNVSSINILNHNYSLFIDLKRT